MEKVSIGLSKEGPEPSRSLFLGLRGYEGEEQLRRLVLVIEDSLARNFPSVEVHRNRAVRELFEE